MEWVRDDLQGTAIVSALLRFQLVQAAKKVDLEAWFPSQERYREVTSCSNTTDYQARRLGVRFRREGGSPEPVHTLNGTMVTDRALLAILENFQGDVPDALRPYGAPERVER